MSTKATKEAALKVSEWIRDGVAVGSALCLAIGAGVQFGIGYGLMAFGGVSLGLMIFGMVRK